MKLTSRKPQICMFCHRFKSVASLHGSVRFKKFFTEPCSGYEKACPVLREPSALWIRTIGHVEIKWRVENYRLCKKYQKTWVKILTYASLFQRKKGNKAFCNGHENFFWWRTNVFGSLFILWPPPSLLSVVRKDDTLLESLVVLTNTCLARRQL